MHRHMVISYPLSCDVHAIVWGVWGEGKKIEKKKILFDSLSMYSFIARVFWASTSVLIPEVSHSLKNAIFNTHIEP